MCGICGIFNYKEPRPVSDELVRQMARVMTHRGPDDEGFFLDNYAGVGLGHRRLSIIDLATGHQPLSNEDNSLHLIVNGEIYNSPDLRRYLEAKHRFKTKSDAETILHLYEEDNTRCIEKLNGIFAFALWDSHKARLVLARDHFGVKPLYYYDDGTRLLFASEIKSLLTDAGVKRELDIEALNYLLTFRYVPAPFTLFHNIRKLPPAHRLICSRQGITIEPYWNYIPTINYDKSESQWVEELQVKLYEAVKRQMISDIPVGALLSGGVDSGTIVALMSELSKEPIKTFTVGFQDSDEINEITEARQTAQLFWTEHYERVIGKSDYRQLLGQIIWHLEEPVGTTSALALYQICRIIKEKVKVVLTGQGADEPFAGYDRYKGEKYAGWYQHIPGFLRRYFIKPAIGLLSGAEKLKRAARSLDTKDTTNRFVEIYAVFTEEMKQSLYNKNLHPVLSSADPTRIIAPICKGIQHLDHLSQMLYLDTRLWLPDDLLLVGDKMSMANSVEARVPYLDVNLVEFVETIPSEYKLKGLSGKYILKKAVSKWLPSYVINRRKKGFPTPMEQWLKTPDFAEYVNNTFEQSPIIKELFNRDFISTLIQHHITGKDINTRQLFLLLSLELWHRIFIRNEDKDAQ